MALRIVPVGVETLGDWRAIHNDVIPTAPLSIEQVAKRAERYRLTLAYHDGDLVGNATVRPPHENDYIATVIVRILAGHRRQGFGSHYLEWVLADAGALGPRRIETVVSGSNLDGLAFAQRRGFVEFHRYVRDGDVVPFIQLVLA